MTANDVAYSFNRIVDKNTASPGAWIFNNRIDPAKGFTVLDDSTFQLKLARPFYPILGILSTQYCSVVPREVVETYGKDFRRHPVGTGPFRLVAWEEGVAVGRNRVREHGGSRKDEHAGRECGGSLDESCLQSQVHRADLEALRHSVGKYPGGSSRVRVGPSMG